jgi:hypothetical protein
VKDNLLLEEVEEAEEAEEVVVAAMVVGKSIINLMMVLTRIKQIGVNNNSNDNNNSDEIP